MMLQPVLCVGLFFFSFCPSPGINHFLVDSGSLYWQMVFRDEDLIAGGAHCSRGVTTVCGSACVRVFFLLQTAQ
jgi:hypothetical protein